MKTKLISNLVENILTNNFNYVWSKQGLGMMRAYINDNLRLHIWHRDLIVPKVSSIHTHPFSFKSYIVCGSLQNINYLESNNGLPTHKKQLIQCGANGCLIGEPTFIKLVRNNVKTYSNGDTYKQDSNEIHTVNFLDGTVTLCDRTFNKDTESAFVYYDRLQNFVDAKPTTATPEEVKKYTDAALNMLINC